MATNRYYTAHRDHGAIRLRRVGGLVGGAISFRETFTHESRSQSRSFSCNCA